MKKLNKDILGFTKTTTTIGVGSMLSAKLGAESGVNLSGGFATMGGMMPIMATGMMGKNVLRMTKKLKGGK